MGLLGNMRSWIVRLLAQSLDKAALGSIFRHVTSQQLGDGMMWNLPRKCPAVLSVRAESEEEELPTIWLSFYY